MCTRELSSLVHYYCCDYLDSRTWYEIGIFRGNVRWDYFHFNGRLFNLGSSMTNYFPKGTRQEHHMLCISIQLVLNGRFAQMHMDIFWCGSIILFGHLLDVSNIESLSLEIISEIIKDNTYFYTVKVDGTIYKYKASVDSNTKLSGSLFVESDNWTSHVYTFDKTYDFLHVLETSIDFHDLFLYTTTNAMDIYIRHGKKSSITSINVESKKNKFIIKPVRLAIDRPYDSYIPSAIRNVFIMNGIIDMLKLKVNDVVSYNGNSMSLITFSSHPSQVIGVETIINSRSSTLQCMNTYYDQCFSISKIGMNHWAIKEYVDGITKKFIKRSYEIKIEPGRILIPDRDLEFDYVIDGGDITIRKN